jgi:hypothetical protein
VQLSDFDKSRVRYHLGYFTVSVPAGDYSRLEEAMNTVPDSYFYDKVVIQLGRRKQKLHRRLLHELKASSETWTAQFAPAMPRRR